MTIKLTYSQNTVLIGKQIWQNKNLNVSTFRNGVPIKQVKDGYEWIESIKKGEPAWCYYENNPKSGNIYGKLYNYYAVIDSNCLCPKGWHIPYMYEVDKMEFYLNNNAGDKMKNNFGWKSHEINIPCNICYKSRKINKVFFPCFVCKNTGIVETKVVTGGNNLSKFNGLPGGLRDRTFRVGNFGAFFGIGYNGNWWINPENELTARFFTLSYDRDDIDIRWDDIFIGLSIRCIKDSKETNFYEMYIQEK